MSDPGHRGRFLTSGRLPSIDTMMVVVLRFAGEEPQQSKIEQSRFLANVGAVRGVDISPFWQHMDAR